MYDYQVLRAAPLADNFPDSHRCSSLFAQNSYTNSPRLLPALVPT
jgi:hypothetical protein